MNKISWVLASVVPVLLLPLACGGSGNGTASSGGPDKAGTSGGASSASTGSGGHGGSGMTVGSTGSSVASGATGGSSSSSAASTGSGGVGGGVGGGGGGGGAGGGTTDDCATQATTDCAEQQMCAPHVFAAQFGNLATCVDVETAICKSTRPLNGENGVADPAACLAARTASCTTYLSANQPDACKPQPGTLKVGASCVKNDQCAAGNYCFNDEVPGDCSACVPTTKIGDPCLRPDGTPNPNLCDSSVGQICTRIFDSTTTSGYRQTTPGIDDDPTCQRVIYGAAKASCFDGSNRQCDAGLTCGTDKKCAPLAAINHACMVDTDCDYTQGLTCQTDTKGTSTCKPIVVVGIGAKCGDVVIDPTTIPPTTEFRECAVTQAICSADATPVCVALVQKGQICSTLPNTCEQYTLDGLQCTGGRCQVPPPGNACTPQP